MALVRTNLRNTRESARQIRFERSGSITAVNVQKAIEQVSTQPVAIVATSVSTSPYVPLPTDTVLYVDTTTPKTINLPASATRSGLPLEILDATGGAAANNITINVDGAETIDGLDPWIIDTNYGGVKLYPKAVGWKQAT